MGRNQNETAESSVESRELRADSRDSTSRRPSVRRRLEWKLAARASRLAPSAFTLTELLVVITIIAILASLITGAAINALNRAKQAAITLEIQQLGNTLEDFKNTYGAYPPNAMVPVSPEPLINFNGDSIPDFVRSDFELMFRKAFPRHQEPPGLIAYLAGNLESYPSNPTNLDGGMTAAEALVFWLGGFSEDVRFPISGPGGPSHRINVPTPVEDLEGRNRRYDFDLGRLGPRDSSNSFDGRFIEYDDPQNTTIRRRINLWQYTPSGSQQPLVYIDVSRHKPAEYDMHALGTPAPDKPMIHALEKLREGVSSLTDASQLVFVNQGKFQILHAGIDDLWGEFGPMSLTMWVQRMGNNVNTLTTFPEGPFLGDVADTVGNFMTGTLADEQE